jgi:hypothetical protein
MVRGLKAKVVVIRADEGKITESKIVEDEIGKIVKEVTKKALEEWEPERSDLTVLHSKLELRYRKPLPPEVADAIFNLNLEYSFEGNDVIVNLPVMVVSFDNRWLDETKYEEKRIYVIAPYLDDDAVKQLEEYAKDTTSSPKDIASLTSEPAQLELGEEEIRRLEEGLAEAEEEEKPRRRRRKRK